VIRVEANWLSVEPLDMWAGFDTARARVVAVFGAAHPHTAYVFANRRSDRLKVLVHDGIGLWLATRRLPQGSFTHNDGAVPADNNWIENRIRPIALGRANWLFAGSLRAGQRAAAIMSPLGSAKMNDLDPYVYLRNVLERLPTQPHSRIDELLPHRWRSALLH
jgi:hypothetical protein